MIFRIPIKQIPQFWEHIKYAAIQTDNVNTADVQLYCNHLLLELLAGNKTVIVMLNDDKELQLMATITFSVDKITGKKIMSGDNLYGWTTTTADEKINFLSTIMQWGKKEGCAYVYANSYNEKLWVLAQNFNPFCEHRSFMFNL